MGRKFQANRTGGARRGNQGLQRIARRLPPAMEELAVTITNLHGAPVAETHRRGGGIFWELRLIIAGDSEFIRQIIEKTHYHAPGVDTKAYTQRFERALLRAPEQRHESRTNRRG